MEKIFTGPGSEWTYVILGLIVIGIILWAYYGSKDQDQRPKWLKSSKPTSKPQPGYYIVTKMYEDSLELATPETKEKVVIKNSHYQYTGKSLSACPKIVWKLSVPYGHSRYDYKIGSLIIIEADKDELTLYKPPMFPSPDKESIVTTGKLVSPITFS